MVARRSLSWPIFLGVVMIVLVVALTVGWVIVTVSAALSAPNRALYWTVLAVGTTFLVLLLVGVVMYLALSIKAIRLNQRQSNFIDSVTHELKSPLASLKLCLQTLERRPLSAEQQTEFHRFMLEDLQRLHNLIDHLLDAARLDQKPMERDEEDVELAALLERCAEHVAALSPAGGDDPPRVVAGLGAGAADRLGNGVSQPARQRREIRRGGAGGRHRFAVGRQRPSDGANQRQRPRHPAAAAPQDFRAVRARRQ